MFGTYENGDIVPFGQIALADIKNPQGLERAGDNLFRPTANTEGYDPIADLWTCTEGELMVGALEMSNAELSQQTTGMIIVQRSLQASSRIIVTSDEMVQTAINLKR